MENKILKSEDFYKRARMKMRGAVASLAIGGALVFTAVGLSFGGAQIGAGAALGIIAVGGITLAISRGLSKAAESDTTKAQMLEAEEKEF